jgi:hypothetical protein
VGPWHCVRAPARDTHAARIAAGGYLASNNILRELGGTIDFGPLEIVSDFGEPLITVSRVYNTTGNTSGFFSLEPLP